MLRRWLVWSKTALLAVVLLSGGGGLPLFDVLLYHNHAPNHLDHPHFESPGAHGHGDLCRLGSISPYSPQAEPFDLRLPIEAVRFRPSLPLPAAAPSSNEPDLLPQPRAPPGLSA